MAGDLYFLDSQVPLPDVNWARKGAMDRVKMTAEEAWKKGGKACKMCARRYGE